MRTKIIVTIVGVLFVILLGAGVIQYKNRNNKTISPCELSGASINECLGG